MQHSRAEPSILQCLHSHTIVQHCVGFKDLELVWSVHEHIRIHIGVFDEIGAGECQLDVTDNEEGVELVAVAHDPQTADESNPDTNH